MADGIKSLRTIIELLGIIVVVLLLLGIIPSVGPSPTSQAAFSSELDLEGSWVCKKRCPAGGEGNLAKIKQNGLTLTFTNEGGQTSKGRVATVTATDWGITATIESDGKRLVWSNGTVWEKR